MNSDHISVAKDSSNDGELLNVSNSNSNPSKEWVLDFGCTYHMCPNQDQFLAYEFISKDIVLMGNDASCKIVNIGTV